MKRIYFLYFPILIALVGCKNETTNSDENKPQEHESVVHFQVSDSTIDKVSQLQVPELRDSANHALLQNYKAFTEDYLRAMQKNDTQKIKAFRAEAEKWTEKTNLFIGKLYSDELIKVDTFMQQLSVQLKEVKKEVN